MKVYAAAAGELGTPLVPLALHTAGARPTRMAMAAAVVVVAERWAHPLVRRRYPEFLIVGSAVFAEGLHQVIRRWR